MKKNCFNCKYINSEYDTSYEMQDGGIFCEKREYKSEKQERDHLDLLNCSDERYLYTSKSCCELKTNIGENDD